MPRRASRNLTDFELEIMEIVWAREETTVSQVRQALEEAGRPVALPTVRTMLTILEEKGYVKRRPDGRRHAYRAAVSEGRARASLLEDLVERVFGGSAIGMVCTLVDAKIVSRSDLRRIRKLIEEHEKKER